MGQLDKILIEGEELSEEKGKSQSK